MGGNRKIGASGEARPCLVKNSTLPMMNIKNILIIKTITHTKTTDKFNLQYVRSNKACTRHSFIRLVLWNTAILQRNAVSDMYRLLMLFIVKRYCILITKKITVQPHILPLGMDILNHNKESIERKKVYRLGLMLLAVLRYYKLIWCND